MKTVQMIFFLSLLFFLSCNKKESCLTCPSPPTDTTSHNFTFQTFTFGGGGGSQLYDVAIINDTLAYAVGSIYLNDSTGQYDPLPYNLAVWDGTKWDLKKVTVNFRGNTITPPLYGIFAFSSNQIWLVGDIAIYGDGTNWSTYDIRLLTGYDLLDVTKCWGSSFSRYVLCWIKRLLCTLQR